MATFNDPITGATFQNYSNVGDNHFLFPVPGMTPENAVRINNFNPKTDTLVFSGMSANNYFEPESKDFVYSHPLYKKLFKIKKPSRVGMFKDVKDIDSVNNGIIHWSDSYRDGERIVKSKKYANYVYHDSNGVEPGFGSRGGLMAIVKSKLPLIFVQGFDQYYNFRTESSPRDFVAQSGLARPYFSETGGLRDLYRPDGTYTEFLSDGSVISR